MSSLPELKELIITKGHSEDLKRIFPLYEEDFPANERKSSQRLEELLDAGSYHLLLLQQKIRGEFLGYALVYQAEEVLWLDYLAIAESSRGLGYGSYFFQQIPLFWEKSIGMFLEIEIPTSQNPIVRRQQEKRISFYEGLGAQKLGFPYLFPTEEGGFPMHLYFKPQEDLNLLSRSFIEQALTGVFENLHRDVGCGRAILKQNLNAAKEHRLKH